MRERILEYDRNPGSYIGNAAGGRVSIQENSGPYRFRVTFWEDPEGASANRRIAYRELDNFKPAHLGYSAEMRMPPVELENQQAFYFHGLLVYLSSVHARTAYLCDAFQLLCKVKNTHLSVLASLTLYSRSDWRMQSRPELTVTARANNWGVELIRLDGRRRLDGSWRLGQHLAKGLALGQLTVWIGIRNRQEVKPAPASMLLGRVCAESRQRLKWTLSARVRAPERWKERSIIFTFGAVNTQSCSAGLTKDNRWYFDGTYRFDSTRKWNAAIERSKL